MSKTEKNQKVKRTKKIKDVNAPKQPMNAYFFFLKDKRHWLDKFTFLSSNLYKLVWRHF